MKKYILSEKQLLVFFLSAGAFLIIGSVASGIGTKLGYYQTSPSFVNAMEIKNNILFYILLPTALLIQLLRMVDVLPSRKYFRDVYPEYEYPKLNVAFRFGKIALGVSIFVGIVSNFIKF